MLKKNRTSRQGGAALLEILISLLIVSFGLLALAGLQTRMNMAQMESYQRAQALIILKDMAQRMQANLNNMSSYTTSSTPLGIGSTAYTSTSVCPSLSTRAEIDRCEWEKLLQGSSEVSGSTNVGAMIGARGCVEQIQAQDLTSGVCTPAIYRVSVAWQGMNTTVAPTVSCGSGSYGSDDSLRKLVSTQVVVPLPSCS